MKHRIRIQVKNMGQAKRFILFCKKNGLIACDSTGQLHVQDNFDKAINNPYEHTKRKKNRQQKFGEESSTDEILNMIIKNKTL